MCTHCDYQEYIDMIDDMLTERKYQFAEDTLLGIKDWIEDNEHITEKQQDAVNNILNSVRD